MPEQHQYEKKMFEISSYFIKKLEYEIPDIKINGNQYQKALSIVSVTFEGIEGESLITMLDMQGIACSTGSACASGSLEKSHVLAAMGLSDAQVRGTIRFSFDIDITRDDIDYTVRVLANEVAKLRKASPLKTKKRS